MTILNLAIKTKKALQEEQNEKEEIDASESFHVVLEFDFRTPKKKPAKPPSFLTRKSGAVKAKKKD